jgi:hypothetical protein
LGNKRQRVRNDTFSPSRIRGAAIAGLGMLAWRWWRNRQATGQPGINPSRPFDTPDTPSSGTL